jgi:chemotaxis protein MotB
VIERSVKGLDSESQYIWLTIYSDLITNLFLLFLSLFALSYFGPDAMQEATASMRDRLEYSKTAAPWYEDIAKNLNMISDQAAPVVAREDRLQMALPEEVLFSAGSGDLKNTDLLVLHALANVIRGIPYTVLVEGHTDNIPPEPGSPYVSNWELSLARAMAVVNYLTRYEGVSPKRLGVAAFGEFHPRVPNDTPAHRAENRRIEISVLRYE